MLVDGHEDLALNALAGRDYLGSTALEIRAREGDAPPAGLCMLSLADWKRAGIGVVFATIAVIPRATAFRASASIGRPRRRGSSRSRSSRCTRSGRGRVMF